MSQAAKDMALATEERFAGIKRTREGVKQGARARLRDLSPQALAAAADTTEDPDEKRAASSLINQRASAANGSE